ncbi:dihydroneopterin aldolase [Candidatus Liberibacter africanus]|uniref:7,8-dihydroneopterin aldolase n=1 Tax=Candidatus Liberibacter africanus PTSAPSY TaxID=1277257 RepID=A0A0G3I411_LIBAF|nr:dihydroneopterin aldolase [Candidatus Liberibacter africanus]AKK20631.1 dihydroneopterin aldolase [Candidatus Liberibacter africanus PTSAPSY]QTP64313.1 dihydroneopterin aldolase [Candidatus Liberibacter africanus]
MFNTSYTIFLKNCSFFAYHGVYKEEQSKGQQFFIDIEMRLIKNFVLDNDNIENTIDYSDVFTVTEKVVIGTRHNLIESLANEIATKLLKEFKKINHIIVTVRKPNAPIKGTLDYVEVKVEYSHEQKK